MPIEFKEDEPNNGIQPTGGPGGFAEERCAIPARLRLMPVVVAPR
jgi:hypothetical protein